MYHPIRFSKVLFLYLVSYSHSLVILSSFLFLLFFFLILSHSFSSFFLNYPCARSSFMYDPCPRSILMYYYLDLLHPPPHGTSSSAYKSQLVQFNRIFETHLVEKETREEIFSHAITFMFFTSLTNLIIKQKVLSS